MPIVTPSQTYTTSLAARPPGFVLSAHGECGTRVASPRHRDAVIAGPRRRKRRPGACRHSLVRGPREHASVIHAHRYRAMLPRLQEGQSLRRLMHRAGQRMPAAAGLRL